MARPSPKKFEKLGILTIRDLLLCYPRKYIDYTQPYTVVSAPYDVECCVRATVLQKEPARRVKGGRVMNRVLAADDSGILALSWFNAPYAADKLEVGETYYFEGRIGGALTRRELLHPLVRTEAQVADCPFVAVYPGTDGLPASRHASCAHAALAFADQLVDPLPPELLTRYRMPAKAQAVRGIHAPKNADDLAAARRRLIFEELYLLQIGIFLLRSHGRRKTSAPMHPLDLGPFWRSLPYPPTGAQKRSTEEILADLCGDVPMNRLLQGDVGSGKTLVAAAAIWFAAQNGWQSAMLAPTEILARQHAATLADRLEPFGVNVTLLVGGMKAKEKRIALEAIADGRANLVAGTHAVLTDTVEFKNLGLAIVDEQHRFGVRQRGLLAGKAQKPAPAGHERHAHPAHAGAAHVRRPGYFGAGRAAAGPQAHQNVVHHRQKAPRHVRLSGQADRGGASGLHRLPGHRAKRSHGRSAGRHDLLHRDRLRTAAQPAHRPAARQAEAKGKGRCHAEIQGR